MDGKKKWVVVSLMVPFYLAIGAVAVGGVVAVGTAISDAGESAPAWAWYTLWVCVLLGVVGQALKDRWNRSEAD